jgi:tetratricopeptide (TPR) repeat protein
MSSQMAIADAYNALGDDTEAQRWYRKALASSKASELINAEKIDYLIPFSQCLAHVGRHEEAVTAIQEALTLAPDDPETLYAASLVYCVVGEPVSARIHARRALTHNVSPAWFRLPWLEPLLEDPELARLISGGANG